MFWLGRERGFHSCMIDRMVSEGIFFRHVANAADDNFILKIEISSHGIIKELLIVIRQKYIPISTIHDAFIKE